LAECFDVKQDLMALEFEQMEEELDALRCLIDKRREKREAIIEHRLREVTSQTAEVGW
jgi:hypothetical protein